MVWFAAAGAFAQDAFLLRNGTVHTISGPVLEGASVLVRDGKVIGVGKGLAAPDGVRTIDVTGKHVFPGMIDSASFGGHGTEPSEMARENGVVASIIVPEGELGPVKLEGKTVAMHLRFPVVETVRQVPHESEEDDEEPETAVEVEPIPYAEAKAKHDRELAALNRTFEAARRYRKSHRKTDLRLEALVPVLDGSLPLLVTAVREREIREAIEFADAQHVRMILADAAESYKVIPEIQVRKIPVILQPTFSLPLARDDDYDRSYATPGQLFRAGVPFAIATFSANGGRNLPYQAAAAVPFGLPHDEAYKAVSLSAARIFGLKSLGAIEEGKRADLIVTDGDPLEVTTRVTMEFLAGVAVDLEGRRKALYQKYLGQP